MFGSNPRWSSSSFLAAGSDIAPFPVPTARTSVADMVGFQERVAG